MSTPVLFGLGALVSFAVMTTTWAYARRINNYSVVDPVWALCFSALAALYAGLGVGWAPRRALLLLMVGAWSLRLGLFLARRIYAHHPKEDGRYAELRRDYGTRVASGFFRFFQIQAASVVLLACPFLFSAQNDVTAFNILEMAGAGLFFLSFVGEALADAQMARFKRVFPGRTCDVGLWAYSRHPNYFFESCIWWAFYLYACGSPYGVYTAFAPLFMLFILTCVTGVPPSEAQALRSRGEEFRAYQQRVSVFVPWFPKRGAP